MRELNFLYKKFVFIGLFLAGLFFAGSGHVMAQDPVPPQTKDVFYRAQVTQLLGEKMDDDPYVPREYRYSQTVEVRIMSGDEQGKVLELDYIPGAHIGSDLMLAVGDMMYVVKTEGLDGPEYYLTDRYRLTSLIWIFGIFVLFIAAFAGLKGLRSLLGLGFTVFVLIRFVLPAILDGKNPVLVSLLGAVVIAIVSLYLAHGFHMRTTMALASTLITIGCSVALSFWFVRWAQLFGLGSEETLYLQSAGIENLNLRGLLLGGIIIGVLGVLDDITTAQTAAVDEIHKANQSFGFAELYRRGLVVGREHIASLVNTLALAYVGASFPLFLLFSKSDQPLAVLVNSEIVAEEIIRTLVGSASLVLAVPISTFLAVYAIKILKFRLTADDYHHH